MPNAALFLYADACQSFQNEKHIAPLSPSEPAHCAQDVTQCDGSRRGLRVIGFVKSESKCKFVSTFSQVFVLLLNNLEQLSTNKLQLVTGL